MAHYLNKEVTMGKEYRINFGIDGTPTTDLAMRAHCQRPGKRDENGDPIYKTEQAHKDQCDINKIIRKYDRDGIITHIQKFEGQFGDMTGLDFRLAYEKIFNAKDLFNKLPSKIRKRFMNNPEELLKFMEDPNNRQEAINLNLIKSEWTEETDGIGEHVPEGGNVEKPKDAIKDEPHVPPETPPE